ncbi:MAG: sensor histidine kinase [Phenylobacterium sp.]|uniref:sensor histidine kinase n=1 Tax=Phenylobacterium sp. TaxID=1871053 RepID=UPI00120D8B54|nr:sensor histidine kinase [Phenylobacterium sp.]TAL33590.1 MAG: sensor histidine kinase [Phenylobacterium sp.]
MTDFLVRRIARQPRGAMARIALGLALAVLALGIRLSLAPLIGMGAPFTAFLLAVLVAAVFGGVMSAITCTAVLAAGGVAMLAPFEQPVMLRRGLLSVTFFVASCGFVTWMVALLRAALAREVAAREAERLLKLELHHRVKNTLAVVQSLAHQTFRDTGDVTTARDHFDARLSALAGAHDLLVDSAWRPVTLDDLATQVLAPFRPADPARLVLDGPPTNIPSEVAVALVLCLHELATNATKYGALCGEQGRVRLAWALDDSGPRSRLELEWRETGGPPPKPSLREGFGTRLLSRALSSQAGAVSVLEMTADGARWRAGFEV